MSNEKINEAVIEKIFNLLSPPAKESLCILSIPTLLYNSLAETLLVELGNSNGNSQKIIEEIRSFPIWHYRTKKSWVIDDDVRKCTLKKLNGTKTEMMNKVLDVLKDHTDNLVNVHFVNRVDYDLQILRLSSKLEKYVSNGIHGFRNVFNLADKYNQLEIERVVDLYLEESFIEFNSSGKLSNDEILNIYFMRGFYAYRRKNFDVAIGFFLPVYKSVSDSIDRMNDIARVSHLLGIIWTHKEQWEEAEQAFIRSINLLEHIGETHYKFQVYHSYGNLLSFNPNRYDDAETFYEKSLYLIRQINNPYLKSESMGKVNHSFGRLLSKINSRWYDAQQAYSLSINSFENIDDLLGQAYVNKSFGKLLSIRTTSSNEADEKFKKSLELLEKVKDSDVKTKTQAQVYHEQGNLFSKNRSTWEDAEKAFGQSEELFSKIDAPKELAQVYYDHGKMLSKEVTRREDAEKVFGQSEELFSKIDASKELTQVYEDLAKIAKKQQDFNKAKQWYHKALDIFKQLNQECDIANEYYKLGVMAQYQQDFSQAEQCYLESLKISEKLGLERNVASIYYKLGLIAQSQQQFDQTEKRYKKALEISERLGYIKSEGWTLFQIGVLYHEQNNFYKAVFYFGLALTIATKYSMQIRRNILLDLAIIMKAIGKKDFTIAWQQTFDGQKPSLKLINELEEKLKENGT